MQFFLPPKYIAQHPVYHAGYPLMPTLLCDVNSFVHSRMWRDTIQIIQLVKTESEQIADPWLKLGHSFGNELFQKIIDRVLPRNRTIHQFRS
ncbi:hypothetical protein D3C78_1657720 [compost metagenome]